MPRAPYTPLRGHYSQEGRCSSGKRAYVSRRAAKAACKRLASQGEGHLRPYECVECSGWHAGHVSEKRLRGEDA